MIDNRHSRKSVGFESFGRELRTCPCDCSRRRRLNIRLLVVEFQFLPFEATHLMEWQNVDSCQVAEAGCEMCDPADALPVTGEAGYQHKADPNRFPEGRESARKLQHWPNLCTRKATVTFFVAALDVEQNKVYLFQLCIRDAAA